MIRNFEECKRNRLEVFYVYMKIFEWITKKKKNRYATYFLARGNPIFTECNQLSFYFI